MNLNACIRRLEQDGHQLSIQDGQIKVVSVGHLDLGMSGWLRANKAAVLNFLIGREMARAIDCIERAFDPALNLNGHLIAMKSQLDFMELNSVEDIQRWKTGWLKLIKEQKETRYVG